MVSLKLAEDLPSHVFHLTVGSKPLHPDKKMNAWENLFYVVTLHNNFPFEAHLSAHILWQSLQSPSLQGNFVKMILSLVKVGKKPLTYRFRKKMHQIRLYIIISSSSSSSSSSFSFTSSSITKTTSICTDKKIISPFWEFTEDLLVFAKA